MAAERRHIRSFFAAFAGLALLATAAGAAEPEATIADFFGTYIGNGRVAEDGEYRDIIVAIAPAHKGFSIYTSTVIRKGPVRAVPGVKWRAETQRFVKSSVPHLYEPMLRESMFAQRRSPNLLRGDTVAWASIRGHTLGVYAMDVLEDGHYELRVYERTLTDLGMDLRFTRYRDGIAIRRLEGILARADD